MFHRSYYQPQEAPPYYHYNQEVNPFPHQPFYESNPYNEQPVHQTPYEYFAKPQQPNWQSMMQHPQGNYTSHPQQQPIKPVNSIMSNFQNQDGKVDIDKMLGTVGQMANTYHQVSPIFKQFGTFLKGFR